MRRGSGGRQLAFATVALYVVVTLGLALPPGSGRVALLAAPGTILLVIGVRSNRAVLTGAALVVAAGGWALRPAVDTGGLGGGAGLGRWLAALLLGAGLLAVAELARLAVDGGPRRGPVRVEAALRRATERRFALTAGIGLLGGCLALVVTGAGRRVPPSVFLPLGILSVGAVVGLVAALSGAALPVDAGGGDGRGDGPTRSAAAAGRLTHRRTLVALVVAGSLALPALAALGAVAPLPGAGTPGDRAATDPAGPAAGAAPPVTDPLSAGLQDGEGVRSHWLALGIVVVLSGVALLLVGGERMVSADDLRPDVAPPDDLLVGAPTAPDVRALPPRDAAAVLEDALRFLRADLEPRLAVRCAYAAVAGGLGRRELGRKPAETELEFLERQLSQLAERPAPDGRGGTAGPRFAALRELTALFEVARFSEAPVSEEMRARALGAVELLLSRPDQHPPAAAAATRSEPRR